MSELNYTLTAQLFEFREEDDKLLTEVCRQAEACATLDGSIVVVSDFRYGHCYIYAGKFGEQFGLVAADWQSAYQVPQAGTPAYPSFVGVADGRFPTALSPQAGTPAYQAQTSEVIMTRGYNLPARYVLHTVGPIVPNGCPTPTQRQQLSDCYTNCLDTIASWNKEQGAKNKDNMIRSIAFCCISTGVFGYPQAEAAEVAVSAVKQWLTSNSDSGLKIIFCTFKDYDTQLYQRLL